MAVDCLLPCPFCSSINLRIEPDALGDNDSFVECGECEAMGPSGISVGAAIALWNRRTSPRLEAANTPYSLDKVAGL